MKKYIAYLTATGWKGRLVLMISGALTSLTLAPFYIWPLLVIGYGVLFLQLSTAPTPGRAFWRGWWWGFGFFLMGLYWICIALTIDIQRFGWLIPFALIGLNGCLAFFTAISAWLFRRFHMPHPLLCFALALFIGDMLRAHLFTGFPWNLIGYSWGASDVSAQAASLFGIYGLTLITPFLAATPALYCLIRYSRKGKILAKKTYITVPALTYATSVLLSLVAVMILVVYGWQRLSHASQNETEAGLRLRLVQGNIPQDLKWDPEHMREALDTQVALSQSEGQDKVDVIIWAETAFPFTLYPGSEWFDRLGSILKKDQLLITGSVVAQEEGEAGFKLWNSVVTINHQGKLVGRYDKRHLVPFGEYMPLRHILPLEKITPGTIDFSHGTQSPDLLVKDNIARALVCYEVIFPSYSYGEDRADWLLNVTNDAWYGNSSGPYQHRDMARFRAIEQGIPIVRVANTGITVAYDVYGRPINQLAINERGVIDIILPSPLRNTLYGSITALIN